MAKGFTQPDWLMTAAQEAPTALALVEGGVSWTYAALSHYAGMAAASLAAAGLQRGDRVGLFLPNCAEYVVFLWGLWRLGATAVPLNARLTSEELAYAGERAGCKAVLVEASRPGEFFAAVERAGAAWYTIEPIDRAERVPTDDALDFGSLPPVRDHDFAKWDAGEFTRQAFAAILFTSGTSGRPKAAQLTFNNFYYAAMASTLRLGNEAGDRWLLTLPLYHVGGLSILVRACLCRVPVVVLDRFEPGGLLAALSRHRITLVSLVPTMLYRLLSLVSPASGTQRDKSTQYSVLGTRNPESRTEHPLPSPQNPELRTPTPPEYRAPSTEYPSQNPFPPSVRLVLLGGAAAETALLTEAARRGVPVATTYGLTEAASQVCTALPDEARAKPGTVGRPLPFMRVRVVGEDGEEMPPGEVGEIVVQGPNVMFGYLGETPPEIPVTQWGTPAYLPYQDGFKTGDLGYMDVDGDLFVLSRRSDLIVSGGENVYPAEVERVLREHSEVADVAVVGVPSAEWGQQVAALVVPQPGAGDSVALRAVLEQHARKLLAGYKVPRVWRFIEALPLNASGKVDRAAAAQMLSDGAG